MSCGDSFPDDDHSAKYSFADSKISLFHLGAWLIEQNFLSAKGVERITIPVSWRVAFPDFYTDRYR